nr:TonB-dependent receptor [Parabacteroides goldsteinii]
MRITFLIQSEKTKFFSCILITLLLLASASLAEAQNQKVRLTGTGITLRSAFEQIEKQTKMSVDYDAKIIDTSRPVQVISEEQPVGNVMKQLLLNTGCTFTIQGSHILISKQVQPRQRKIITGLIKDERGDPVIGASVLEKGTTNGTITDLDGKFRLEVTPGSLLSVSFIGYKSQEIPVTDRTEVSVVLKEDTEVLEEVVVVGYGTQKKSSMTAAVASVSAKEIQKQVTGNVASAMQGRTPGVEVLQKGGEAGADVKILVRGAGTFGSTEPLYIIDGAVSNNGLNSLNPNDIESIEILKDGSAAAIYGSRAANGVVLITTKQGKAGRTIVEINGSYSYQTLSKKLDFMNADQWRTFANQVADNSGLERAPENVNPTNPGIDTDWQDLYFRNAPIYNLNAGISGGGENTTFNTSLGYFKQDGIIVQTDYEKYNARVNGTFKKGMLTVSENLSIAHTVKTPLNKQRMIGLPTAPVKDEYGRYVSIGPEYNILSSAIENPIAGYYNKEVKNRATDVTGSLSLGLNLFKGFNYKLNLAGSYLNTHNYTHTPTYSTMWDDEGNPVSGFGQLYTSLGESRAENFNYTIDNLLTYNNTFKGHTIDVLLGTSWMREYYRTMSINSNTNDLGAPTITGYEGEGTIGAKEMNAALLSFFARVNYDYRNRYLLSLSIRSDKSSKFAKGHRVGYFPSVSIGWNVHEEEFFNIPWMDKLKIRGSYGELGANFIDPYSFLSLAYGPVPAIFGGKRAMGYVTRFAQEDLTWETAISSNVGIELSFLDNSLSFTADWFLKRNNDLLAPLAPLPSSGQTIIINDGDLPYFNTASVENKGLELSVGYRKVWGDFSMDASANISFLKNKVRALGDGVQPIRGESLSSKFNDRATITKKGLPIGTFWGYQVTGIDGQGNFIFEDNNGVDENGNLTGQPDGVVDENDKKVIGNPNPDFTYGLNISLGYKNWDFTAFFQGSQGNDIFCGAKYYYYFNYTTNSLVDVMNSWTKENPNASLPIAKTDNYNGGNSLPSTFYIENGSYFRCKNLQVGYSFDEQLLKATFIKGVRIYAGVQNLFTITKYPMYDPEVSNNTLFDRGIDGQYDNAPTVNARVYNVGFKLTF